MNFLHYILESPDGKDTKISNARQQINPDSIFKKFIHPLVILNRDLINDETYEAEIKQLELAVNIEKNKEKIDLL